VAFQFAQVRVSRKGSGGSHPRGPQTSIRRCCIGSMFMMYCGASCSSTAAMVHLDDAHGRLSATTAVLWSDMAPCDAVCVVVCLATRLAVTPVLRSSWLSWTTTQRYAKCRRVQGEGFAKVVKGYIGVATTLGYVSGSPSPPPPPARPALLLPTVATLLGIPVPWTAAWLKNLGPMVMALRTAMFSGSARNTMQHERLTRCMALCLPCS
jgi:hypothetical protein